MNEMYSRIEKLCKKQGINITQMCKEADVPRGALTDLKMNRTIELSTKSLAKLAAYFGVPMEYLLGNEQKKKPTGAQADGLTEEELKFIEWFRKEASEKDKALVRMIVEGEK